MRKVMDERLENEAKAVLISDCELAEMIRENAEFIVGIIRNSNSALRVSRIPVYLVIKELVELDRREGQEQ